MKKILHVSKYYYPFRGGTEQIAQDCVKSLADICEQKVICFNHEKGDAINWVDGVEVIRCGCFGKISSQSLSISYVKILNAVMKNFLPDIVIFHYPNPFVAEILLHVLPKQTKLVVYWHLDIVKQKFLSKLFFLQNHLLLKRASIVIATSPCYIDGSPYLGRYRSKCVVVPNCINENRLKPTMNSENYKKEILKSNKGKIICVAVGRHTKYKGFSYLINASKLLDDRFRIFIIGKGELTKELKKEAAGDRKVTFLGSISDDELKAYLSAMDIFCFPSITKNEAFGVALAEGMYYGKPAVTFTISGSGVNYVSINRITGLEVPNCNIQEYASAMIELADNPDLRMKYGANGKKRVQNNFMYSQFKENIRNVIASLGM